MDILEGVSLLKHTPVHFLLCSQTNIIIWLHVYSLVSFMFVTHSYKPHMICKNCNLLFPLQPHHVDNAVKESREIKEGYPAIQSCLPNSFFHNFYWSLSHLICHVRAYVIFFFLVHENSSLHSKKLTKLCRNPHLNDKDGMKELQLVSHLITPAITHTFFFLASNVRSLHFNCWPDKRHKTCSCYFDHFGHLLADY